MHDHLVANLRLAMSVFLTSNVRDAQKLLEEEPNFRELELAFAATHLNRLAENTIQTHRDQPLHIDIISDLEAHQFAAVLGGLPVLEASPIIAAPEAEVPSTQNDRL